MRWNLKWHNRQWQRWFAWYPIRLSDSGEYAWLETVWRSVTQDQCGSYYQYEIDLGETRALDQSRLQPTLEEIQRRACNTNCAVAWCDQGKDRWVLPNGQCIERPAADMRPHIINGEKCLVLTSGQLIEYPEVLSNLGA
jgi:hypothetical protein